MLIETCYSYYTGDGNQIVLKLIFNTYLFILAIGSIFFLTHGIVSQSPGCLFLYTNYMFVLNKMILSINSYLF